MVEYNNFELVNISNQIWDKIDLKFYLKIVTFYLTLNKPNYFKSQNEENAILLQNIETENV